MTAPKARPPLAVGERVKIKGYGRHESGHAECLDEEIAILVEYDSPVWIVNRVWKGARDQVRYAVFPGQLRRLVKRKRRSVWIHVMDIPKADGWNVAAASLKGEPADDHIEFREVPHGK